MGNSDMPGHTCLRHTLKTTYVTNTFPMEFFKKLLMFSTLGMSYYFGVRF